MHTFRLFSSYKKHVYRSHAESVERETALAEKLLMGTLENGVDTDQSYADAAERQEEMHTEAEQECEPINGSTDYVKQVAILFLKWKEQRRLPESTVNEIANDVISFVKAILEDEHLQPHKEVAGHIKEVLCKRQLDHLLTASGRNIYWRTHLPLIEPRTVVLGTNTNGKVHPTCMCRSAVFSGVFLNIQFFQLTSMTT